MLKNNRGYTLTEIIVACIISLMVMLTALYLTMAALKGYDRTASEVDTQTNMDLGEVYLEKIMRSSYGYKLASEDSDSKVYTCKLRMFNAYDQYDYPDKYVDIRLVLSKSDDIVTLEYDGTYKNPLYYSGFIVCKNINDIVITEEDKLVNVDLEFSSRSKSHQVTRIFEKRGQSA